MTRPHYLRPAPMPKVYHYRPSLRRRITQHALVLLLIIAAFTVFMVFIGWPALIHAAETEADTRYMKRVVIGISETDRHCKQWQQRTDAAWICVQR